MMKLFLGIIGAAVIGAIVYAYVIGPGGLAALPIGNINDAIDRALLSAPIDASDFGGGKVVFENGEAAFGENAAGGYGGFALLGKARAIAVKGEDADVYVLVNINGGGTGTFAHLVRYEYTGATSALTEVEKIFLGDRIAVGDIKVEFTAPNEYQVLVSIKDRKKGEAMAAEPTESRVLHFKPGAEGLEMTALTFGTLEEHDVILFGPFPEKEIDTTFMISGAARGMWYFEASFPIHLMTLEGEELAVAVAQAQGEWMTEELVPFTTTMVAPSTASGLHMLVIKKDNPSGLPEHDKSYEIPVVLK